MNLYENILQKLEAAVHISSPKQVFLKIFQNSQGNIYRGVSFQIKLQASRLYYKWDSSPSVSLEYLSGDVLLQNTLG